MDGKVVIGTALDTKDLEKDIKNAQRQLAQYEKEAEKLTSSKAKIQVDLQAYEQEKQAIQEATDKSLELVQTREQVNWVLDSEKMQLEELNQKYSKQFEQLSEIDNKIESNANEQEILKQKVQETTREYEKQKGVANIKDILKDINKETNSVVNKVGRWALAVFGVRSAYMFIRQAMSTLSQYDDQMATNVEYIRYLLASALKPLIETLINLAYQLLQYLNMIMQSWFGINLFANATTEEFMKQKKEMGGTSKAAKELQKTLAGFDEMNILQKDGSTSSGGGGGGIPMPKFPEMSEKRPEWMQWIIDHKDEIIAALAGITAGLIALKGASMLKSAGIIESFPLSKLVGIALIVSGLVYAFEKFKEFDESGTLQSLGGGIEGIGTAVVGAALVFSSLFTGIIGGAVISYGAIIKYWDDIKKLGEEIVGWLQDKSDWVHKTFGDTIGLVYDIFIENLELILSTLDRSIEDVRVIFKNVIKFIKDVFKGDWKAAWEDIKKIFSAVWDNIVTKIKGVWQIIKNTVASMVILIGDNIKFNIKIAINSVLNSIESILNGPISALNGLIDAINGLPGVNIKHIRTISLPRLAKGGIINMPGRGVPVGSAIAGERGQEGIIPLTDSQQMALLGEAIGKYITINANITNTMNGRVISKELQKIQAENDFAFNK